ncbi:MAG: WYL domain-containing transcriptional factor [Algiphilus sp.]
MHRILAKRRNGVSVVALREVLADRGLDCSRRTVERDLTWLRDHLDAPLVNSGAHGWRYESERNELPGLWFSDEALAALLLMADVLERQPRGLLAKTLGPFRNRLEALLERQGSGLPAWRQRLRLLRMAGRVPGSNFDTVAGALSARRRLLIHDHARSTDQLFPRAAGSRMSAIRFPFCDAHLCR